MTVNFITSWAWAEHPGSTCLFHCGRLLPRCLCCWWLALWGMSLTLYPHLLTRSLWSGFMSVMFCDLISGSDRLCMHGLNFCFHYHLPWFLGHGGVVCYSFWSHFLSGSCATSSCIREGNLENGGTFLLFCFIRWHWYSEISVRVFFITLIKSNYVWRMILWK